MRMYKYELFKIISRKSIYVLLVLIIAMMAFANNVSADMVMNHRIYEELEETYGGPITEEKNDAVREKMRARDEAAANNPSTLTEEERHESNVHFLTAVSGMHSDELITEKENLQGEMTKYDSDSYEYKAARKKLNRLEELEQPYGFYVIQAWRGLNSFIDPMMGSLFLAILILIGLSAVFSDEHTHRTAGIIAASKHGKRKIVTAKIFASLTYLVGIFLILHIANLLIHLNIHGGFAGWDVPMQSFFDSMMMDSTYKYSPFNWNILQTYIITLSVQFIASVMVAILVLFISSRFKNTMIGFFLGSSILIIPMFFSSLGLERFNFFKLLIDFSYIEILKVEGLINAFKTYNLFGHPILYPVLVVLLFVLISLGFTGLTYYGISKQEINE